MATGGYKAAEWIFTVKTSSTASTTRSNVQLVLKNVCNLIMQCEPHWTHDAEYTATEDDFIKIGSGTANANQEYAHFLINTVTGSRLLVCYLLGVTAQVQKVCCCDSQYNTSGGYYGAGLCFSMIPGGSTSRWDVSSDCTTIAFIPNDATLLLGPANTINNSAQTTLLGYYNGVATRTNARYVVLAKEDLIFVALGFAGETDLRNSLCIGKIFGKLCNDDDDQYYSRYGSFLFKKDANTYTYETVANSETTVPNANWLNTRADQVYWNSVVAGCYFRSSTTTRPVTYVSGQSVPQIVGNNAPVGAGLRTSSVTSGKTAFGAFLVSHSTNDANSYGVVPGNCFKGYLDTDFFRNVYYGFQYDTLFDGGNFIYAGGGIALGWDPSNTITLRG